MKAISSEQVLSRIKTENPWWKSGNVQKIYTEMTERPYLDQLYPLITDFSIRRSVVLMGPRRVGKTVIIFHAINRLINDGIPVDNILYISVDHPLYNNLSFDDFIDKFKTISPLDLDKEQIYIFFDEVQYLKNWEVYLKKIVDTYPNMKCIVSGSAAAALKLKSRESGAGRFTDFLLPPLTFYEYLLLLGKEDIVEINNDMEKNSGPEHWEGVYFVKDKKQLNKHFIDYLNYGGYPELALSSTIRKNPQQFIKSDIIDKVLLRDLPSLYGINDIQELNQLFTTLAYNTGDEVSLGELSKNSGVAKNTIKKYIEYLEAAFLIKTIHRIDQNAKKFERATTFKVYLTNPSIRAALFTPIDSEDPCMGMVVETAIFSQWFHRPDTNLFYARWHKIKSNSGEIDIVRLNKDNYRPTWAVEVKWTDRYVSKTEELKGLVSFCHKHNLSQGWVTTKTINEENKVYENISFHFIMASLYAYILGYNTITKNQ
jgi:predicted AAA+ superfamily ATPase